MEDVERKVVFVVRDQHGAEKEFETVQEAFTKGGGVTQSVEALAARKVFRPAVFAKDEQDRYYGPVLRP